MTLRQAALALAVVVLTVAGTGTLVVAAAHRFVTGQALERELVPADVIVVLGAAVETRGRPNRCLQARISQAADLYRQGLAQHIIVTGGPDQGTGLIEAEHMARWLAEQGVPATAILQERRASSTTENIAFSTPLLQERGWRTVLLVSDPYHLPRATALARRAGWDAYPAPATDSLCWTRPNVSAFYTWRETALVLRDLGIGEVLGWG